MECEEFMRIANTMSTLGCNWQEVHISTFIRHLACMQARQEACMWNGEESSCGRMYGLAVTQIILSVTDFFIGMYLQFNDLKLASETRVTRYAIQAFVCCVRQQDLG